MFRRCQSFVTMVTLMSMVFSLVVKGERCAAAVPQAGPDVAPSQTANGYGKMLLLFETNKGQTDDAVKFVARTGGYTLYLTAGEAVFQLRSAVEEAPHSDDQGPKTKGQRPKTNSDRLTMKFTGANAHPAIEGAEQAITQTNYYIDKNRIENVKNYGKAVYNSLYDGIDAVFYGKDGQLEYDFNIAPNSDPGQIELNFDGARAIAVNESGDLVVKTENAELIQQKPYAYQTIDGKRCEVASRYVISDGDRVTFDIGEYDRTQTLTIDPALKYLTYIGGTAFDDAFEIAADAQGSAYFTGETASLNFYGNTRASGDKLGAYVAKLNPQGTAFVYLTILEGNGDDTARGIALDASNNAYVTGIASHFFPTTAGAYDTTHGVVNNDDVFIAKLGATGNLIYSSFLGGNDEDEGFDVAVDSSGKAYVVGDTFSNIAFPSKNKYQGCGFVFPTSLDSVDAFLTVMNPAGSDITYSTCIGGSVTADKAFSVALDSSNNAYVTGLAQGGNFPTKNAFQPNSGGGIDAWAAKFNPAASGEASLIYSTYIGGSGTDQGNGIAVDSNGQAVVVGQTGSLNFPLQNAFRSTNQINEGFVTVLNPAGNGLINSSFLGGADQDNANNVALDSTGSIYVTGNTRSNDFPMALPFQATRAGVNDAFVTKLKFGRGVISSSYLGGNGNDNGDGIAVKGNLIYAAGDTASTNLATTSGVISPTFNGGTGDGFVAKILDTRLDSVGVFRPTSTFLFTQSVNNVVSQTATLTANLAGQNGVSGDWNGDGIDTIGSFTNGTWKVRDLNFPLLNLPPKTITFGQAGDLPVSGDWNGDGIDTPGVFRPSTSQYLLTNSTSTTPPVDITINFGLNGDLPISGDWNGDGIDSVGAFRPSVGTTFLTDDNVQFPGISQVIVLGSNGDLPVAGDFDGNSIDTVGVWRPSTREFFLTNDNATVFKQFVFGNTTDQPIVGDWDGMPTP